MADDSFKASLKAKLLLIGSSRSCTIIVVYSAITLAASIKKTKGIIVQPMCLSERQTSLVTADVPSVDANGSAALEQLPLLSSIRLNNLLSEPRRSKSSVIWKCHRVKGYVSLICSYSVLSILAPGPLNNKLQRGSDLLWWRDHQVLQVVTYIDRQIVEASYVLLRNTPLTVF